MGDSADLAATGGDIGPSDGAAGGIPTGSDAPELQGLGGETPDPTDPENGPSFSEDAPFDPGSTAGDAAGSSDPMPDTSGTSG